MTANANLDTVEARRVAHEILSSHTQDPLALSCAYWVAALADELDELTPDATEWIES